MINKQEAQQKLISLQKEVDELRKIINNPEKDWRDIKTVKDAVEYLGDDDPDVREYVFIYNFLSEKTIMDKAYKLCIKAINQGWMPDFSDSGQPKYYNSYRKIDQDWVLDCSSSHFYFALLGFGFYFESEEKAKHGGKYFLQYICD